MLDEVFDIMFLRWVNVVLIVIMIFYAHMMSRKLHSFYVGVPLLIWLFQALLFYLVYFSYTYEFIILAPEISNKLHSYWASSSKLLGLITMFIYLYYIQHSCWRGNGQT